MKAVLYLAHTAVLVRNGLLPLGDVRGLHGSLVHLAYRSEPPVFRRLQGWPHQLVVWRDLRSTHPIIVPDHVACEQLFDSFATSCLEGRFRQGVNLLLSWRAGFLVVWLSPGVCGFPRPSRSPGRPDRPSPMPECRATYRR